VNNAVIEKLKLFGLTDYEAKAYSALVSLGTASVTEVSQICDVPRSNLYSVLESLSGKGFADIQKGRPILFKAIAPDKVLGDVEKQKNEEMKSAKKAVADELGKISRREK
jgi:sugar-specific transcriptional regulator TrmB